MGLAIEAIKFVGGNMAGIGADLVAQYAFMSVGKKCADSKFAKACVLCGSWAVGTAAHAYAVKAFENNVDEMEEAIEILKKGIKNSRIDYDEETKKLNIEINKKKNEMFEEFDRTADILSERLNTLEEEEDGE